MAQRRGFGSVRKIGKFVRFDVAEIDLWIAERRVDVAS